VREKELNKNTAPCVLITITIEEITMTPKRSAVGVAENLTMQQRSHVDYLGRNCLRGAETLLCRGISKDIKTAVNEVDTA
jgi:hypothetical protein